MKDLFIATMLFAKDGYITKGKIKITNQDAEFHQGPGDSCRLLL